ncbi:MAG TPA: DUF1638 domain-containing protein [Solirubrobacteraceae bacterium]|jgi:hypothetical protein
MSRPVGSPAVVACGALALDVRRIAARRGWEVEVVPVPALLHNRPQQIAAAVAEASRDRDVVAVAYGDCGTQGALDDLPRLPADTCYDVLGRDEVRAALAEQPGTYFLTDFLARTFEHTVVRELGLDRHPELRREYFRNYTRVIWLAQRPTPATRRCAERAAARLELPLEEVTVGNAGLERSLERLLTAERPPAFGPDGSEFGRARRSRGER